MTQKEFSYPHSWEERRPALEDGVLFVPTYYSDYQTYEFPGWSSDAVFGNENPVHIEYCSGNGTWICEKAAAHPEINWVAVEKRFDRVKKIWKKQQKRGLKNLLIVCGEAACATRNYFASESVVRTYVNFPDPWPKDRHAKHRLINSEFVAEMARVLVPEGDMILVTDDQNYSGQMVEALTSCGKLSAEHAAPFYVTDLPGYGTSYFDSLWRGHGKEIRYHIFNKLPQEVACAS